MTASFRVAVLLSTAFHPFVTSFILVGGAAWSRGSRAQARSALLAVLAAIVPVAILMVVQVRRGRWENVDASNVSERPVLFTVALVALAGVVGWLTLREPDSFFLRGASMVLAMLVVAAIATRWVKLSLHVAFAALAATVLTLSQSPLGYVMIPVVPLVAWSRLVLARHTTTELACGAALGIVAGAIGILR